MSEGRIWLKPESATCSEYEMHGCQIVYMTSARRSLESVLDEACSVASLYLNARGRATLLDRSAVDNAVDINLNNTVTKYVANMTQVAKWRGSECLDHLNSK